MSQGYITTDTKLIVFSLTVDKMYQNPLPPSSDAAKDSDNIEIHMTSNNVYERNSKKLSLNIKEHLLKQKRAF